jgi:hypothetical protein
MNRYIGVLSIEESVLAAYMECDRFSVLSKCSPNVQPTVAKIIQPCSVVVKDQTAQNICAVDEFELVSIPFLRIEVRWRTGAAFHIILVMLLSSILGFKLIYTVPAHVILVSLAVCKRERNKLKGSGWTLRKHPSCLCEVMFVAFVVMQTSAPLEFDTLRRMLQILDFWKKGASEWLDCAGRKSYPEFA